MVTVCRNGSVCASLVPIIKYKPPRKSAAVLDPGSDSGDRTENGQAHLSGPAGLALLFTCQYHWSRHLPWPKAGREWEKGQLTAPRPAARESGTCDGGAPNESGVSSSSLAVNCVSSTAYIGVINAESGECHGTSTDDDSSGMRQGRIAGQKSTPALFSIGGAVGEVSQTDDAETRNQVLSIGSFNKSYRHRNRLYKANPTEYANKAYRDFSTLLALLF